MEGRGMQRRYVEGPSMQEGLYHQEFRQAVSYIHWALTSNPARPE